MQPAGAPDGLYFARAVTCICSPSIWIVNGVPEGGDADSFTSKLHDDGQVVEMYVNDVPEVCDAAVVLLTARVATYVYVEPDTRVRLVTVICSLSTWIVNGVPEGGALVSVTLKLQGDGHPATL
jgi:hypothetical protein